MANKQLEQYVDGLNAAERDHVRTISAMAERARKQYAKTKEWTSHDDGSCMTIRVPVALLNRIRELAELTKQ